MIEDRIAGVFSYTSNSEPILYHGLPLFVKITFTECFLRQRKLLIMALDDIDIFWPHIPCIHAFEQIYWGD